MKVSPHLDKIGILGSTFAALCCLGVPAVISLVSAVGLGFLINDAILGPLLVVFLLVTLWGLWSGWTRHGRSWVLVKREGRACSTRPWLATLTPRRRSLP